MGDSNISWTDKVWNPIRGCSVVSAGCKNCYAMTMAARFAGDNPVTGEPLAYKGLAYRNKSGAHWTGKVSFIEKHLNDPLKWKEPKRIFVNSMSDLFHEAVENVAIDRIFAVMALAKQHTFQVLTKRPERMQAFCSDKVAQTRVRGFYQFQGGKDLEWPLPNVHLGVSCEDQKTADERIPLLLETPAAVRFVSYEPALGPVDFRFNTYALLGSKWVDMHGVPNPDHHTLRKDRLHWLIAGGESGAGHRPIPDGARWIESAVDQCRAAGVPVFVKQSSGLRPGQQGNIPDAYWLKEFPKNA